MRRLRHIVFGLILGAALLLLAGSAAGCSFVLDFTECEADADCEGFDAPEAGEFLACSTDNKCVIEPERECREDAHCSEGQACEQGVCSE